METRKEFSSTQPHTPRKKPSIQHRLPPCLRSGRRRGRRETTVTTAASTSAEPKNQHRLKKQEMKAFASGKTRRGSAKRVSRHPIEETKEEKRTSCCSTRAWVLNGAAAAGDAPRTGHIFDPTTTTTTTTQWRAECACYACWPYTGLHTNTRSIVPAIMSVRRSPSRPNRGQMAGRRRSARSLVTAAWPRGLGENRQRTARRLTHTHTKPSSSLFNPGRRRMTSAWLENGH